MNVYTDGSCLNNGKPNACAGIGIFFGVNDNRNLSLKLEGEVSNNISELTAILTVFQILKQEIKANQIINIYSDSEYSINSITIWAHNWSKNNWKKQDNNDIKNVELIKKTYKLFNKYQNVKLHYIKAHSGGQDEHSLGNEEADTLAKEAIGIKKFKYKEKLSQSLQSTSNQESYVFTFGKYKGRNANWVKENDEGYIHWCIDNLKNKKIIEILKKI